MELKLPFGIRDGKLIEVSEVARGVACGCFCPACNQRLVAKKGNQVVHHFAHDKSPECANALETTLHVAAKDIFERFRRIRLPAVHTYVGSRSVQLHPEQMVEVDQVHLEKRRGDIVPDVVLDLRGRSLFVEIAVTNLVGLEKEEKIKEIGISAIEIDLSNLDRQIGLDSLKSILIDDAGRKRWIHNAKEEKFRTEIQIRYGKEMSVVCRGRNHHVEGCPLKIRISGGKPYASLDDCSACEYLYDWTRDDQGVPIQITCIGHMRHEIVRFLESYEKGGTLSFMYERDDD